MRPILLPDVPYGATAVRETWLDLPEGVREAISERLGAPVTAARSAGGGFTHAFAAVLTTSAGLSVFVKAAPLQDPTADWYAREAAITTALPVRVSAARPRWTLVAAGYFILCLDMVDGHVPALPWPDADLDAALNAWSTATEALAEPSAELLAIGLPPLAEIVRTEMSWWSEIAAGRAPTLSAGLPLRELAALERDLPALVAGTGMLHGDLRIDNVLIDRSGAAWLCDWTWPCLGAPWFDTVTLLITAYASGLDADARLSADVPPEGVNAALAALSGYWLTRAASGPSSASPHSRQHQRYSGAAALGWLSDRRGWT